MSRVRGTEKVEVELIMTDKEIIQRVKKQIDPDDDYVDGFSPVVALKIGRYIESKLSPKSKPFTDKKWNLLIGDFYFYELER